MKLDVLFPKLWSHEGLKDLSENGVTHMSTAT